MAIKKYGRLRFRTLSGFTYLPGKIGTSLTIGGISSCKKKYIAFNKER